MFRRSTLSINSRLCLHRLVSTGAPKGRPRRVSVGESAPPSPPADEPVKRPRARRSKDPPKEPKKEPRSRKQASPVLEHTNVVDEALEDGGVGNILAAREHETGVKANQDLPRHPMGLDGLLNNPLAPDWTTRPSVDPPTPSAVPPLPPLSQWKSIFPVQVHNQVFLRERVSIKNPRSARMIAESFVPNGLRDQVIIEAFPGPGVVTRALLKLPKERIRKLIVLEDWPTFLDHLRPLEKADPRVHVIPLRGFHWEAYDTIEKQGLLDDVPELPWDTVHPHLRFISHIEQNVQGEQLIAQLFRMIPEQAWLFKYGRVPLKFLLSEKLFQRLVAKAGDKARCKMSVVTECTAHVRRTLPSTFLHPYQDHLFPDVYRNEDAMESMVMTAISAVPFNHQIISADMLEKWDYCLRRLFTLKSTSLKDSIKMLGIGAQSLLPTLSDPSKPTSERVDTDASIKALTLQDWERLVKVFDEWPFAPESLNVAAFFVKDQRR